MAVRDAKPKCCIWGTDTWAEIHFQAHRAGSSVSQRAHVRPAVKHGLCVCPADRSCHPKSQALLKHNHRPHDHLFGEEPLSSKEWASLRRHFYTTKQENANGPRKIKTGKKPVKGRAPGKPWDCKATHGTHPHGSASRHTCEPSLLQGAIPAYAGERRRGLGT